VIRTLATRFAPIAEASELTVVYDAGQDSAANQLVIEGTGMHFVGSLRPSDHPDLLKVARSRYLVVDEAAFPGVTAFESRTMALGAMRRVVVTHSDELHTAQARGFEQTLGKARRRLVELQRVAASGHGRRSRQALEQEITLATRARWVSRCLSAFVIDEEDGGMTMKIEENAAAKRRLENEIFGKRVLFSDHEEWSIPEIVSAYRSQWHVEADFRQMKDPDVVSFSPMFHWTDQKIRVHAFYCTLALTVARLMVREAKAAGIEMSVRELLHTLGGIEETVLIYPTANGRPRARRQLTEMDATQLTLFELFDLAAHAPKA
jgi:transposase